MFQGTFHGNQIIFQKRYQRQLIPLAFVALMLENELQYHGLAVHFNSGGGGATSSKNFANFFPGNSRDDRAYCERQVRHGQKTGIFS